MINDLIKKLEELRSSISGNYYLGEDKELELIEECIAILKAKEAQDA